MKTSLNSVFQFTLLATLAIGLFSCKEEEPPIDNPEQSYRVLISNEGAFATGEGTLSLYEPEGKTLSNDAYKAANTEAMGNIFQSIASDGEFFYLVINNSNKIIKVDSSYTMLGEITGLTSPRYMYIKGQTAYVTDLFATQITIVNLNTLSITGSIATSGWTETAAWSGNDLLVTNPGSSWMYIVNTDNNTITDSLEVGGYPQSVTTDDQGNIYTMGASGDSSVLKKWSSSYVEDGSWKMNGSASQLNYNPVDKQLYCLNGGLMKGNSAVPFVAVDNSLTLTYPYAMGIDPKTGDVYFSDALDFTQRSTVYRYNTGGTKVDEFKAGIITGGFFFLD